VLVSIRSFAVVFFGGRTSVEFVVGFSLFFSSDEDDEGCCSFGRRGEGEVRRGGVRL